MTGKPWGPWLAAAALVTSVAGAETPAVSVTRPADCLPTEDNAVLEARVSPESAGELSVRLYFRRVSPEPEGELFYFVEMVPRGGGVFRAPFPKPEDRPQLELTRRWWDARAGAETSERPAPAPAFPEARAGDWLGTCDFGQLKLWFASWIAARGGADAPDVCRPMTAAAASARGVEAADAQESAEYFVALYDAGGEPVLAGGAPVRSPVFLVRVRDDCPASLSARERGWAATLTVGETAESQRGDRKKGEAVYHWLCQGITARLGVDGVPRADAFCRRCVIGRLPPVAEPAGEMIARLPAGAVR